VSNLKGINSVGEGKGKRGQVSNNRGNDNVETCVGNSRRSGELAYVYNIEYVCISAYQARYEKSGSIFVRERRTGGNGSRVLRRLQRPGACPGYKPGDI
jgi:hypothetical protein